MLLGSKSRNVSKYSTFEHGMCNIFINHSIYGWRLRGNTGKSSKLFTGKKFAKKQFKTFIVDFFKNITVPIQTSSRPFYFFFIHNSSSKSFWYTNVRNLIEIKVISVFATPLPDISLSSTVYSKPFFINFFIYLFIQ